MHTPNLVKIGWCTAELLHFYDIENAGWPSSYVRCDVM